MAQHNQKDAMLENESKIAATRRTVPVSQLTIFAREVVRNGIYVTDTAMMYQQLVIAIGEETLFQPQDDMYLCLVKWTDATKEELIPYINANFAFLVRRILNICPSINSTNFFIIRIEIILDVKISAAQNKYYLVLLNNYEMTEELIAKLRVKFNQPRVVRTDLIDTYRKRLADAAENNADDENKVDGVIKKLILILKMRGGHWVKPKKKSLKDFGLISSLKHRKKERKKTEEKTKIPKALKRNNVGACVSICARNTMSGCDFIFCLGKKLKFNITVL